MKHMVLFIVEHFWDGLFAKFWCIFPNHGFDWQAIVFFYSVRAFFWSEVVLCAVLNLKKFYFSRIQRKSRAGISLLTLPWSLVSSVATRRKNPCYCDF